MSRTERNASMSLPLQPVPFERVTFTDNFWAPRQKLNREVTLPHHLETTRGLVRDFESLAEQSATKGNYEPSRDQHLWSDMFVHNVTEALAATLAATPDRELQAELDRRIAVVAAAQDDDGYLHSYHQIHSHKRWNDISSHELFVAGHLMEAAVTHYRVTGEESLLTVARRLADHIETMFARGDVPFDRAGHPEVEMALAKLYDVTGKEEYLDRARSLVEYARHAEHIEEAHGHGHAVRATNFFAGMVDVAMRTGDRELLATAERVWRDMVNRKMYITGGLGEVCTVEGFHRPYELSDRKSSAEMCAALGNVFFTHRLLLAKATANYADALEQTLYNGVLGAGGLDGKGLFYAVTLFSRGCVHRDPRVWCCPTNWVRFVPQVGGLLYATSGEGIYVNLYAGSRAEIEWSARKISVTQTTDYPWQSKVSFEVSPDVPATFALHLRKPHWSEGVSLAVNGEEVNECVQANGYLVLRREWKTGDTVELAMSMPVECIEANPQITTGRGYVALKRGPLLYCLEAVDNGGKVTDLALPRDSEVRGKYEENLLGGVVTLTADGRRRTAGNWRDALYRTTTRDKKVMLKAIPFYAWDNRTPGEMQVWIPETTLLAESDPGPNLAANATVKASVPATKSQLRAVNDGLFPGSPGRWTEIPTFKWDKRTGTEEWISLDFGAPIEMSALDVYWVDEYFTGDCLAPAWWRVDYLDEARGWQPVRSPSNYGTDQVWFSRVNFEPVRASAVRIVAQLKDGKSGGIYEIIIPLETPSWRRDQIRGVIE